MKPTNLNPTSAVASVMIGCLAVWALPACEGPGESGQTASGSLSQSKTSAVLLVVGESGPNESEMAFKTRLERLCQRVVIKSDVEVQLEDALATDLVVLSEGVHSENVGNRLSAADVPMLVMEPALFDDLGLTGHEWAKDQGDAFDVTSIRILDPLAALAAGFDGEVAVTNSPDKFVWGTAAPSANVVANLVDQPDRAAIFSYEAGAAMVGRNAPERRVGFFAGRDAARAFAPPAWQLFDAAVHWLLRRESVLVVGAFPLSPSDAVLRAHLLSHKLAVRTRLGRDVAAADFLHAQLGVVSESVLSSDVGTRLTDVAAPLLVMEPALFDDLSLTGSQWTVDFGDAEAQTTLVVAGGHPLSASHSGRVEVSLTAQKFVWASSLPPAVQRVASIEGHVDQVAIFALGNAQARVDGTPSPGPRVGWFTGRDAPAALNAVGLSMLDAAIDYLVPPLTCGNPPKDEFDTSTSTWTPEARAGLAWTPTDAMGKPFSGSLLVTNQSVANRPFLVITGGYKCIPVTSGANYDFSAQVFLPQDSHPSARGALGAFFFAGPNCSGVLTPGPILYMGVRDSWQPLTLQMTVPPAITTMAIRLMVLKEFVAPPAQAMFDDVQLTTR